MVTSMPCALLGARGIRDAAAGAHKRNSRALTSLAALRLQCARSRLHARCVFSAFWHVFILSWLFLTFADSQKPYCFLARSATAPRCCALVSDSVLCSTRRPPGDVHSTHTVCLCRSLRLPLVYTSRSCVDARDERAAWSDSPPSARERTS